MNDRAQAFLEVLVYGRKVSMDLVPIIMRYVRSVLCTCGESSSFCIRCNTSLWGCHAHSDNILMCPHCCTYVCKSCIVSTMDPGCGVVKRRLVDQHYPVCVNCHNKTYSKCENTRCRGCKKRAQVATSTSGGMYSLHFACDDRLPMMDYLTRYYDHVMQNFPSLVRIDAYDHQIIFYMNDMISPTDRVRMEMFMGDVMQKVKLKN